MASELKVNMHPSAVEHALAVAGYAQTLETVRADDTNMGSPVRSRVIVQILTLEDVTRTQYPGIEVGLSKTALEGDIITVPGWKSLRGDN